MVLRGGIGRTGLAFLILGLAALPAGAASITNRDDVARALKIIEGSNTRDHQLAAGATLDDVCKDGCLVRIDGSADKDFVLEGTERVSIEGGLMYYDGEVTPKEKPADK